MMMKWFLIILGGLLFGGGLVISGMTDPSRVIAFLDILGKWDPALGFVMGSAVPVFAVGLFLLRHAQSESVRLKIPDLGAEPIKPKMLAGSAIFGVGWGLGGFCPGPAFANLAAVSQEALVFLPLMFAGMWIAQRLRLADQ